MKTSLRSQWLWVLVAGATGWLASVIFSSLLHWRRPSFVVGYGLVVLTVVTFYIRTTGVDLRTQLRRHWVSGAIGGMLVGLLLGRSVWLQPESGRPGGPGLVGALVWYGIVYGAADALLLNVLPVLSVYGKGPREELRQAGLRFRWGLAALAASLLVTAMYHLGFAEFRGPSLIGPLFGNGLITAGYLLTGNPLAAILGHIVMHGAAVMHGMDAATQLPPHY